MEKGLAEVLQKAHKLIEVPIYIQIRNFNVGTSTNFAFLSIYGNLYDCLKW